MVLQLFLQNFNLCDTDWYSVGNGSIRGDGDAYTTEEQEKEERYYWWDVAWNTKLMCLRPLETTEDLVAEIQNFLYNHESKNQIFSLELKLYVS